MENFQLLILEKISKIFSIEIDVTFEEFIQTLCNLQIKKFLNVIIMANQLEIKILT